MKTNMVKGGVLLYRLICPFLLWRIGKLTMSQANLLWCALIRNYALSVCVRLCPSGLNVLYVSVCMCPSGLNVTMYLCMCQAVS